MKLTKAQADFVIGWLRWVEDETVDADLWTKRDDELFKQVKKKYSEEANK